LFKSVYCLLSIGGVFMKRLSVLLAVLAVLPLAGSTFEKHNPVDKNLPVNKILFRHWQENDIEIPAVVSDALFLRRVTLTACGRLPTAAEVRDFLNDDALDKRARIIDKMLDSPEYADMQTMRFADMLRIKSEFPINLWPNAVQAYHRKIHDDLRMNRSLNDMFYEMLTASGSNFRTPYANFFRASADRSPEGLAKMVLLTTMNMREDFLSSSELKEFAVLFSNIRYKSTYEWKEEIVFNAIEPRKISARLPDGTTVSCNTAETDPRILFADWLLKGDNDFFARGMTNRVWYWCFGKGIYPAADALPYPPGFWARLFGCYDQENVPFSPELQEYLIAEFKNSNYSLKHLYRVVMNSAAFQASSMRQEEALLKHFAAYPLRRLESELLIDALAKVTGSYDRYMSVIPEPFTYLPWGTKAINIADGSISSGVLDSFGRPPRDSGQFSERNTASTDSQKLYLMNSTALYRRIGTYCRSRNGIRDENQRLDRIYLDILSRYPTSRERELFHKYKMEFEPKQRNTAWIDTVWVLLNSKEFIFHH